MPKDRLLRIHRTEYQAMTELTSRLNVLPFEDEADSAAPFDTHSRL